MLPLLIPVRLSKGSDVIRKLLLATLVVASAAILVAAFVPAGYDGGAYTGNAAGAGGAAPQPGAGVQPAPVRQASPAPQPRQNAAVARTTPTYAPSGQGQGASGGTATTNGGGSGDAATKGGWTTLSASMTGDAEVPGPGAPGATGQVTVRIKGEQVCFQQSWSGIKATAAHLHRGARGAAGPIVVPFFRSTTPLAADSATGCVAVDPALARELRQRPGTFYANVHTVELPAGAIRGQLALAGGGAGGGSLPLTGLQSRAALLAGLVVTGFGFLLVTSVRRRPAVAGRHARGSVRR